MGAATNTSCLQRCSLVNRHLCVLALLTACTSGTPRSSTPPMDSSLAWLTLARDSYPQLYEPMRAATVFGAQTTLHVLGFGTGSYSGKIDPATQEATLQFEAARGLPLTGDPLATGTYSRLKTDGDRALRLLAPATSKRYFNDADWNSGAVVEGPWFTQGDDNPAAVKIECFRARQECYTATAQYGEEQLVPVLEYFDIESWDASEIRSKPADFPCERSVLTLNRVEQSATIVRTTLSRTGLCSPLAGDTWFTHPRVSHLATDDEIDISDRRRMALLLDSMMNLPADLRRLLAALGDSTKWRQAQGQRRRE